MATNDSEPEALTCLWLAERLSLLEQSSDSDELRLARKRLHNYDSLMNSDSACRQMVALVQESDNPVSCWRSVLQTTEQAGNQALVRADVASELASVAENLKTIFSREPIPTNVRYLYFGLFNRELGEQKVAGYYVSGWAGYNADDELAVGEEPPYFPAHRCMRSGLLDKVKNQSVRLGTSLVANEQRQMLDYALMLGTAALLSRFADLSLGIKMPIYVGFDSGDFASVAN